MDEIIIAPDEFLQEAKIVFRRKVHKLFKFGFESIFLERIENLNFYARSTIPILILQKAKSTDY
jgi:hypothetical protein